MNLERVKPADLAPVNPDEYRPIPGRPGWAVNAKGQMQRTVPLPPIYDPWKGLAPVVKP